MCVYSLLIEPSWRWLQNFDSQCNAIINHIDLTLTLYAAAMGQGEDEWMESWWERHFFRNSPSSYRTPTHFGWDSGYGGGHVSSWTAHNYETTWEEVGCVWVLRNIILLNQCMPMIIAVFATPLGCCGHSFSHCCYYMLMIGCTNCWRIQGHGIDVCVSDCIFANVTNNKSIQSRFGAANRKYCLLQDKEHIQIIFNSETLKFHW